MRGKSWPIEQERQLREFIKEGAGIAEISKVMGKTRVSVRSKMYHLGLSVVDAAALQPIAASVASTPDRAINRAPASSPSVVPCVAPLADSGTTTTTSSTGIDLFTVQLKKEGPLPSIEEKLRVLDAALVALEKPGLSMAEISRYNKIIQGVKVYQELFVHFVNYRALETELVELRKQLASEKNQQQ